MSSIFERGSLPVLEALVHFTAARHRAIALNIANADTPGYRAVDAPVEDFRRALARALLEQRSSPAGIFALKPRGGIRPVEGGFLEVRLGPAGGAGIPRPDGNTVDLEVEMGRLVRNGMLHNLSAALLAHQFGQLREAIGERVLS